MRCGRQMIFALLIALSGSWLPARSASQFLDLDHFRDALVARIHAESRSATVTVVNPQTLKITGAGGTSGALAVENARAEYLARPDQLNDLLGKWARLATFAPTTTGKSVEQLVMVIRPKKLRDVPQLGPTLVLRPFAGDLIELLAFDSPESLRWATRADLASLKFTEDEAFARAAANLKARMGPVSIGHVAGEEEGLSAIGAASGLATGLLANGATCSPDATSAFGRNIHVYVLDRDSFAFAVDDDSLGMEAFRRFVAKHAAAGDLASRIALRCAKGIWVVDR